MVDERGGPRAGARAEQGVRARGRRACSAGSRPTTCSLPGAIARVVAELERDPTRCSSTARRSSSTRTARSSSRSSRAPFDVEAMVRACANHVVQPGSLFRRRAWELAGPLNEDGHYLFDFEFALAVGREGAVCAIPDRLALYRVHPESKSGGASLLEGARLRALRGRVPRGVGAPRRRPRVAGARTSRRATTSTTRASSREARRDAASRSLRLKPTRRGAGLLARTLARSVMP